MAISRDVAGQLELLLRPIRRQLSNMISRVTVQVTDDGGGGQSLQVGAHQGEDIENAEHVHPYGFTSHPLPGAEGVDIFPGGDRGHPLIVAIGDRRYRPSGKPAGHVAIYHYTGAIIEFSELGDVVVTPAPGRDVLLGSDAATDRVARASDLQALADEIQAAVNGAGYGAALKAALAALYGGAGWPQVTARTKSE